MHFWRGKFVRKNVQPVCCCQLFAKHTCTWEWVVLRQLISITYFQRYFIKRKGKTHLKHENTTVLDSSCVAQEVSHFKFQKEQVTQIDFLLFILLKKHIFHKGVSPQCIFHVKCQHCVTGPPHILCEQMQRVWDCIFGIPRAVAPVESICCFCFLLLGEIWRNIPAILPGLKNYFINFLIFHLCFRVFLFCFFFNFSPGRFDRDLKIDQYSNCFLLKQIRIEHVPYSNSIYSRMTI